MKSRYRRRMVTGTALAALAAMGLWPAPGSAETIESALIHAYQNNPQLNAQRAQARAVDETVPQALSGYRPKVSVTATGGPSSTETTTKTTVLGQTTYTRTVTSAPTYSVGATLNQTLFDGFITPNKVKDAEGQVSSAREALRVLEQSVLLAAATAYLDVLRDSAELDIQRSNVRVLDETLKQTRDRYLVGEVTATDVAQAEAQLAAGKTSLRAAEAQLVASQATYRQVIGSEPINLEPASPVDRVLPPGLPEAIDRALNENPNITAANYGVDVAFLQVKIQEGALFPTLSVQANVNQSNTPSLGILRTNTAELMGQLTVPIYQGGAEYSLIRQSKETLTQQRLNLDFVRAEVRQQVVQAWGSLQATKAQVQSAQAQVASSETALNGVREESRVGQRTTIDVLNAQQTLVNARIALAVALHDRVVTSYSVLSATGRLSPQVLSLQTPTYDPTAHYQQVRDAWFGLRTPDGDPNFNLTSEDYRPAHTSEAASASASGMARDNPKETGDQQATGDVAIQPQPTGDGDRKPQPEPLAPLRTTPVALTGAPTVIANQGGPAGAAAKPHSKPRPMPMAAPGRDDDTRPMAGSTAQTPSSRAPRLMPGAQPLVPVGSFSGRMAAPKARPQPAQPEDPEPEPAPRKPIGGSTASNGGLMPGAQPLVPAGVNDLNSFSAVR